MWEIHKSGSVRDVEVVFAWLNIVTLLRSKERSNREYKANLTETTILRLLDSGQWLAASRRSSPLPSGRGAGGEGGWRIGWGAGVAVELPPQQERAARRPHPNPLPKGEGTAALTATLVRRLLRQLRWLCFSFLCDSSIPKTCGARNVMLKHNLHVPQVCVVPRKDLQWFAYLDI